LPTLCEALKLGGIHYRISGTDKESVFRAMLAVLHLPEETDREFLLKMLLAREELASTGIGEGIAIPHTRNPIVLNVPTSMIALGFLEQPLDFGALDKKPVYCLFTLVSATARVHLHLLSRLAFVLHDTEVKQVITGRGSREDILHALMRAEASIGTGD